MFDTAIPLGAVDVSAPLVPIDHFPVLGRARPDRTVVADITPLNQSELLELALARALGT
ncbi:MAG: hypothetical protein JNN03_12900 [Rubrivivax sp.]|nr:hypothetical protein [Rubrivivax sp.]